MSRPQLLGLALKLLENRGINPAAPMTPDVMELLQAPAGWFMNPAEGYLKTIGSDGLNRAIDRITAQEAK